MNSKVVSVRQDENDLVNVCANEEESRAFPLLSSTASHVINVACFTLIFEDKV